MIDFECDFPKAPKMGDKRDFQIYWNGNDIKKHVYHFSYLFTKYLFIYLKKKPVKIV